MDAKEWRKTEIELKAKHTKLRNKARNAGALHEKLAILREATAASDELHNHRLNYHSLVSE